VNAPLSVSQYLDRPRDRHHVLDPRDATMFSSLVIIIDRLRTAKIVALLKDVGPYAAIELLLPGGSLLALGLWLYSRHKSGKPLLPFSVRVPALLFSSSAARRLRASSGSAVRRLAGLDLFHRRLSTVQECGNVPVTGVAFGG
jgi:hypothetical protein